MVDVTVSDLAGTFILLLVYIALMPVFQQALDILLPMLGPTESFIAQTIPLILIILIAINPLQTTEQNQPQTIR